MLVLRLYHHLHGSSVSYAGICAAAFTSWIGLPGPGEAALVAAGVLAARHKLDIGAVVAVAWAGATAGGMAGWVVGLKGGRALVTARGPLRRRRLAALEAGERFYARHGALAVFFTPSWVAGINEMRWPRYVPANAVAALMWALVIGLGAFLVGRPIAEVVDDIGLVAALALGAALVTAVLGGGAMRRRRARR